MGWIATASASVQGPQVAQGTSAQDIIDALSIPTVEEGTDQGQTRGLHIGPQESGAAASSAAPRQTVPAAVAPPPDIGTPPISGPSIDVSVQFGFGSAELTRQARSTLDEVGQALSSAQLESYRFLIAGHTDAVGSEASNLELSQQRAAAVVDYLAREFSIAAERLESIGFGETWLLLPDDPTHSSNRRVQITNLGAVDG